MATFGNADFQPLPFMGANIQLNSQKTLMHHERTIDNTNYAAKVDEKAWAKHREDVRRIRSKIYEESDYHAPIELYAKYPMYEDREKFRVAETPAGKWLAELDLNWIYVNDAAEVALLTGRTIDRHFLEQYISPYTPEGEKEYAAQLAQFRTEEYAAKVVEKSASQTTAEVVEVYDDKLQLLCICPNMYVAAKEFNIPATTIHNATINRNLCHNKYYFRAFYDNGFKVKNKFPFEQLLDGRVVNRFPTVKDAAEMLQIQPFAIYRMIREPNKVDQYGCHWRKNKG